MKGGSGIKKNKYNKKCYREASQEILAGDNISYVLVEYSGDIVTEVKKFGNLKVFITDENHAILSVADEDIDDVVAKFSDVITYRIPSALYTLCATSPVEASGALQFYNNEYLPLDGRGVIIGILDTGIDYLNEEFINEDGTSRIINIWDQTVQTGKSPEGYPFGTEYTSDDINSAIKAKKEGKDPYEIVPSKDENGHGTNMAGIVGARGQNPQFRGTAPRCYLAMVKLTPASKKFVEQSYVYQSVPLFGVIQMYVGIKYLYELSIKLKKPIVILLPLGSSIGSHDGLAFIERYIDEISRIRGVAVVVPTGNEGDTDTHTSGLITQNGDVANIELIVDDKQKNLKFEIWVSKPDKFTLSVTSPSGEIVERIAPINKKITEINFIYEKTKMFIQYIKPEEISGDQKINITALNMSGGIWNFKVVGEFVSVGRYDAYLPQRVLLAPNTKFLRPDPDGTLMIPSTSRYAISVAYYDQTNNAIEVDSGRGYTRNGRIKPDIVAGGINALAVDGGNTNKVISGSSVAAAVVAGCSALIFQWGIIDGKDKGMYSIKLKTYLIRGTAKREGDIYPNPQWGYGVINMKGVFDNIRGLNEDYRFEQKFKYPIDTEHNYFFDPNSRIVLIEYRGDIIQAMKRWPNSEVFIIDNQRALIATPASIADDVLKSTPEIVYIASEAPLSLSDISPIEASGATTFHNNPYLPLDGNGVLVAIIDTGIDYLNEEFINEDGTSRIVALMDRSIPDNTNFHRCAIYKREQINEAIQAKKKGEDPYKIVPSKDEVGHGTNMAGIVAARGANPNLVGVAPRCELVIIKVRNAFKNFRENFAIYGDAFTCQTIALVLGTKFAYELALEIKKPIVIFSPLGSNVGPHNGSAFSEKYIDEICTYNGVGMVISAGNQGNTDTHTSGFIKNKGDEATVEIQIGKNQKDIRLEIWMSKPDKIGLSIVSPTGEVIRDIYPKLKTSIDINFLYEETKMNISYSVPEELTGEQRIVIMARNIREGIWQFKLIGELIIVGRYDVWTLQRPLIAPDTKFLSPTPNTTITTPGTSKGAITVGFYNQNNNSIVPESGKGYTRNNMIKPDLVAGGVNAITTSLGGGTETVTGSSVGAAIVAGACALIFEWGIVLGNDTTMFAAKLKTYLIRGTSKRPGDVYPNPQWGFGMLDVKGVFDNIRGIMELKSRQEQTINKTNYFLQPNNVNTMVEYRGNIESAIKKFPSSDVFIIDDRRAFISLPYDIATNILRNTPEIVYADPGSALTLCDISPVVVSEAPLFHNNKYLPLDGSGVIVGIIDTGIDYLNEEFINEDGTSKIIYIYDQTIQGSETPAGHVAGSIYTHEDINKAIQANKNGGNPYAIVPSKDEIGHGTKMASIIAASGKNKSIVGVAPMCSLAIVKLIPGNEAFRKMYAIYGDTVAYKNTAIFLGMKDLFELAYRLRKPIVIYTPLGTNMGAHNGESYVERYCEEITKNIGVSVVIPTGNQGNTSTHTSGILKNVGDIGIIELKIGANQKNIRIEIWISKPDKVSLSITSPTGEVIRKIPPKLKEVTEVNFVYEETKMTIEYSIPDEVSGEQRIVIGAVDIREGIWQFKIIGELIVVGKYDAWILQRELIAPETRFLRPNPYTTLNLPGTTQAVITAGYYNQNNNSVVPESGRGFTRNDMVKPDIAAGGVNAITSGVGGKMEVISGSSVAGAVVAGSCALLLQWGIVQGNDTAMYAEKLKTYLIRGAKQRPGDVYPNPQWGYGMLSLKGVFDNIRLKKENEDNVSILRHEVVINEYYIGSLFIRLPG